MKKFGICLPAAPLWQAGLLGFMICFGFLISDFGFPAYAQVPFSSKLANAIGIGFIKSGTAEVGVLSWRPDFKLGIFGLGLNVNVPLGDNKPTDFESVVVRNAEFDTGTFGAKYGILSAITLGHGLLMSNYSTTNTGVSGILSSQQTGLKAYYKGDAYGTEVLGTWSKVYALRVTEKVWPPLTLGQTYVTDVDGVNFTKTDGTQVTYPSVSGYSLDAGIPVFPGADLYAEYAHLNGHGSGYTAGFELSYRDFLSNIAFRAERRFLESNFVPEYFNAQYETDPIDIASYEANNQNKDGYRAELNAGVFDMASLKAVYENYNGSNSTLGAEASAQITDNYFLAAGFWQPNFQSFRNLSVEEGAILTGKVGYRINPFTLIIVNYKKAYDPVAGLVVESTFYEARVTF
jgi:hypothetical protein